MRCYIVDKHGDRVSQKKSPICVEGAVILSQRNQYCNTIIIDVVDDAVVSGDVTRISHIIAANEGFWMS